MEHDFDQDYWDAHWQEVREAGGGPVPPNPHLVDEISALPPGTVLEAGCGEGAEAIWLAQAGWQVTAADIAQEPLARAAAMADADGLGARITWVRADLGTWEPGRTFDLVTTHYAHPAMPQLAFYERLSGWVAPGGSLFVVGHRRSDPSVDDSADHAHPGRHRHDGHEGEGHEGQGHGAAPPAGATVTAASITELFDPAGWDVVTAQERTRSLHGPGREPGVLRDVVVRAVRRARTADA